MIFKSDISPLSLSLFIPSGSCHWVTWHSARWQRRTTHWKLPLVFAIETVLGIRSILIYVMYRVTIKIATPWWKRTFIYTYIHKCHNTIKIRFTSKQLSSYMRTTFRLSQFFWTLCRILFGNMRDRVCVLVFRCTLLRPCGSHDMEQREYLTVTSGKMPESELEPWRDRKKTDRFSTIFLVKYPRTMIRFRNFGPELWSKLYVSRSVKLNAETRSLYKLYVKSVDKRRFFVL